MIQKWLFLFLVLLVACKTKEENNGSVAKKEVAEIPTLNKLKGKWQEEADSAHTVVFTDKEMITYYNGTEVSRYKITFFNGWPGEGGYEAVSGRVIQIEESTDNFHHFKIVVLDRHYLELLHRSSGKSQFFKRL